MTQTIIRSSAVVLVVALICGSTIYGCQSARNAYRASQAACVSAGGSWIHRGSVDSYNGDCLQLRTR